MGKRLAVQEDNNDCLRCGCPKDCDGRKYMSQCSLHIVLIAIQGDKLAVVYLKGSLTLPSRLAMGSNKTLIGAGAGATITGAGINIKDVQNVIVRNLEIYNITGNDGFTIQNSKRVWIDHNELHSVITLGPDYYDSQIDIVHASDWVTVSWNYLHDHWKVILLCTARS